MASLYKHPRGYKIRFFIYFPDGSKKEIYRYSNNKQRALALKQDASLLEAVTRRGMATFDELVYFKHQGLIAAEDLEQIAASRKLHAVTWDSLKKEYETFSKAAHSYHNHKTVLSRIKNLETHFKAIPVAAITVQDILDWQISRRDQEIAPKTIKSERDVLNQMLDIAAEHGAIPFNPGRHKRLKGTLKLDKARLPRALTYQEVKLLLELLKKSPNLLGGKLYLAALICLFGGLRRGELCYLTREDIRGNEIVIQSKTVGKEETNDKDVLRDGLWKPKGNRPRTIDMPGKITKKIRALLPKKGRFIFGGDEVYNKDYISQEFEEVLGKVHDTLTMHCLRHTFVTWRIEHGTSGKGDNLVRVQLVAGHSDIKTTMNYTHIKLSPEKDILDLV